jgi:arylamine N-acetyltransferase
MLQDPLAPPPRDSALGAAFLHHFDLVAPRTADAAFLEALARGFARLPYENLTKIIKHREEGHPGRARRDPGEVFGDHVRWGTGGTCFSLTAFLLHLVRAYGYEAEPILADRRYGSDTHCALVVRLDGTPHLLDPGYRIFRPVPLAGSGERRIETPHNDIALRPVDGDRLALSTIRRGSETYRLTFKLPGADPAAFMRAWHASFSWDMMRYPVVTSCRGGSHVYLQNTSVQVRNRMSTDRREVAFDQLPAFIAGRFGVAPAVAAHACGIVKRKERARA